MLLTASKAIIWFVGASNPIRYQKGCSRIGKSQPYPLRLDLMTQLVGMVIDDRWIDFEIESYMVPYL